ncbi:MAG: hypothetical protein ACI4UO_02550 [Paludibacteraceae bacterium]
MISDRASRCQTAVRVRRRPRLLKDRSFHSLKDPTSCCPTDIVSYVNQSFSVAVGQ